MRQRKRTTHFSMAARACFVAVHVLFKGTWTRPLRWGCVNKWRAHKSIFKHYLFPITLNVHVPRSCFLKIKNRVRSHHPQRPNPCIPEFFTFQQQGGSGWHVPARAASAPRGAAARQNRTVSCIQGTLLQIEVQVHLLRLHPGAWHPKVMKTETKRVSAQHRRSKKSPF